MSELNKDNGAEIVKAARAEIDHEIFVSAVKKEKERMLVKRPLLHRLFPFVIKIERRK